MLIKNMIEDLGDPGSEPIPIMNVSANLPHSTPASPSAVLTRPRTGLAQRSHQGAGVVQAARQRSAAHRRR